MISRGLIGPVVWRGRREQKLVQQIASLQLRRENLLREANKVDNSLRIAQAKHGRLLNENAHIHKIPNEILSHIFVLCQQQHGSKAAQIPFEVLASHVSSMWREIAIGTRLLWTSIVVKVRPRQLLARMVLEWKLDRVRTYLTRSDSCLFSATFDIAGPFQVDQILNLMAAHSQRWRRLAISIKNPPIATLEIWEALNALDAPALEHVSIWLARLPLAGHTHSSDEDYTELIFRGGAPSLTFVRLSGMALACLVPPLRLVETLHLSSYPLSYASFRTNLDSIANLVNLSLHRIHITNRPVDCPPITLPNLRSLRVCGNLDDDDHQHSAANRLIRLLRAPMLEDLVLKDLDVFDEQVFPTVHTLALHACPFSAREMKGMFSSFPALTTFRLDESLPDILGLLGMPGSSDSTAPWPKLHTLAVTDMEQADVELLCDMIRSRAELGLGTSLVRVFLDRRSRVVLRKKGKLEWLQETLQVERHEGMYIWPSDLAYEDNDEGFWEP
ncbi:hypothetical protein C8F01DRAFT_1257297 [Mycena amicta]|nr:hypothetical protein C8F01DRAFT_1257297 [Mycena amicta]